MFFRQSVDPLSSIGRLLLWTEYWLTLRSSCKADWETTTFLIPRYAGYMCRPLNGSRPNPCRRSCSMQLIAGRGGGGWYRVSQHYRLLSTRGTDWFGCSVSHWNLVPLECNAAECIHVWLYAAYYNTSSGARGAPPRRWQIESRCSNNASQRGVGGIGTGLQSQLRSMSVRLY